MEKKINPYSTKQHATDHGPYFNPMYFYIEEFGSHPNVMDFHIPTRIASVEAVRALGASEVFLCEMEERRSGRATAYPAELCLRYEDALVYFYNRTSILSRLDYMSDDEDDDDSCEPDSEVTYRTKVLYRDRAVLEKISGCLEREPEAKKKGNVYLLCSMDGMLVPHRFDVKLPSESIDLALNYGEDAAMKFEQISAHMSSNKSGLVLLSGDPGTGKSTFIKYLTTKTTRKVIYLSSNATENLTSPDFLSFIMNHRNCILLLEDAEKALRSREKEDNWSISNILNITDGILGDCLNIMVVATFNTGRENIDPALVRKGRLLMEHHFSALDADAANSIFEATGSERRTSEPMTLAEIYNSDDNFHEEEETRRVGF